MYTKEVRTKHIWIIVVLIIINFALISIFNQGSVNLAGEYVDKKSVNMAALKTLVFTIPIVGFIIGALVGLLPYKGLTFKQKYLRASLLTIIVINSIMLIMHLFQYVN